MNNSTFPNNTFTPSVTCNPRGEETPSVGILASLGNRLRTAAPYMSSGADKTLKEFSFALAATGADYVFANYEQSALEELTNLVESFIPELMPLIIDNQDCLLPIKTILSGWGSLCVATYLLRYVYAFALSIAKIVAQCKDIRTAWVESISSFRLAESQGAAPLTSFWSCALDNALFMLAFVGISYVTPYFCYIYIGTCITGVIARQIFPKVAACFTCCKNDLEPTATDPNAPSLARQFLIEGLAFGYLRGCVKDLLLLYTAIQWEKNSLNGVAQDNIFTTLSILSYAALAAVYKTQYVQQKMDSIGEICTRAVTANLRNSSGAPYKKTC